MGQFPADVTHIRFVRGTCRCDAYPFCAGHGATDRSDADYWKGQIGNIVGIAIWNGVGHWSEMLTKP